MGIITLTPTAPPVRVSGMGYSPSRSGYTQWLPYPHGYSYEYAYVFGWGPPPGLSAPSIGAPFRNEDVPDEVMNYQNVSTTETINPPANLGRFLQENNALPDKEIEDFAQSSRSSQSILRFITTVENVAQVQEHGFYSYAGLYLVYATFFNTFVRVSETTYRGVLEKRTCAEEDSIPEDNILVRDCGNPLPLNVSSDGRGPLRRNVRRRKEIVSGCCSCATIADMLAQQNLQIKEMFDQQNIKIGETLTDQTQFLQEQIVAAIPKGFDYEPIFNKIEDARNDTWNGLNQ